MKKYILITGAGTGIGRATAIEISKSENHALILMGRREDKLLEVKSALSGEGHIIASADVSNKESLRNGLKAAGIKSLNLTGVFANAGIGGENMYGDDDRWSDILSVNLDGTYNTVMECLPHLKSSGEKYTNIVITSSCLARFGVPNYTAYCTSKAGLLGLTRSLAVQYASEGVLVNAICPGWVDTKMAREGIQLLADRESMPYEEMHKMQMGFVPTGKMSDPEEIGRLVKFLLTNQETSITGQGIDINNGSWMG